MKKEGRGGNFPFSRRHFLQSAGAAGLALLPGLISRRGSAQELLPRRPNIVLIMADDLGYGDLGCYGCESISTPSLDRLAAEGVRLTSFYSCAPVCSPSRAGLLTGRYPSRIGVRGVYYPSRFPLWPLCHAPTLLGPGMNTNELTLAELLRETGYRTCCIGKWHLGDMKRYRPHHRGFDHYFGLLYSNDMKPLPLWRNDEMVEKSPVNQDYLTRKYTEEARLWLAQNHGQPFFLYFAHTFPHIPLHASPEFRGRSKGGLYGDCVEELDWSVGEILAALEKYHLAENTFVFFTSDNGPWFEGSTGGLRGRKGSYFEGGQKVPGIARFPGVIPAGTVTNEMAMNFDLFTTSLALAGLSPPGDRPLDGKNILPLLAGQEPSPHEELFFHGGLTGAEIIAVRNRRWKFHRRHAFWAENYFILSQGPMLFDQELDPAESFNVIDRYPEIAADLERRLEHFRRTLIKGVPRRK